MNASNPNHPDLANLDLADIAPDLDLADVAPDLDLADVVVDIIDPDEAKKKRKEQIQLDFNRNLSTAPEGVLVVHFELVPLDKFLTYVGNFTYPPRSALHSFKKQVPKLADPNLKCWISSKDVLNGEWIQFQGDGREIEGDALTMKHFVKVKPEHKSTGSVVYGHQLQLYDYRIKLKWD